MVAKGQGTLGVGECYNRKNKCHSQQFHCHQDFPWL